MTNETCTRFGDLQFFEVMLLWHGVRHARVALDERAHGASDELERELREELLARDPDCLVPPE